MNKARFCILFIAFALWESFSFSIWKKMTNSLTKKSAVAIITKYFFNHNNLINCQSVSKILYVIDNNFLKFCRSNCTWLKPVISFWSIFWDNKNGFVINVIYETLGSLNGKASYWDHWFIRINPIEQPHYWSKCIHLK